MWTYGKVATCCYQNKHLEGQDGVLASVSPWRSQADSASPPWDQVTGLRQPADTSLNPGIMVCVQLKLHYSRQVEVRNRGEAMVCATLQGI